MSEQLPWFKCEPGKLLGALAALSPDEGYLYTIILLRIYENGGPVREDAAMLSRRSGMTKRTVERALASLAEKGKLQLLDGMLIDSSSTHSFLADREKLIIHARKAGNASAEKRAEKNKTKQQSDHNACPMVVIPKSNEEERELELKEEKKEEDSSLRSERAREIDAEFETEFWPIWPHKVGKPRALMAWRTARRKHATSTILAGVNDYIRDKPPDRSWLNPATFLHQERFADQPAPVARGSPSRSLDGFSTLREKLLQKVENGQFSKNGHSDGGSPFTGSANGFTAPGDAQSARTHRGVTTLDLRPEPPDTS